MDSGRILDNQHQIYKTDAGFILEIRVLVTNKVRGDRYWCLVHCKTYKTHEKAERVLAKFKKDHELE